MDIVTKYFARRRLDKEIKRMEAYRNPKENIGDMLLYLAFWWAQPRGNDPREKENEARLERHIARLKKLRAKYN